MEEIARRVFLRWNLENYFKYIREEYSLDHLVSRDIEPADTERLVPNPQKSLEKERYKKLRQLKTPKEHYVGKAVDNYEKHCRTMLEFNISNYGLKKQIKLVESHIKALEAKIKELPDKVKIKEVLNKNKIIRL